MQKSLFIRTRLGLEKLVRKSVAILFPFNASKSFRNLPLRHCSTRANRAYRKTRVLIPEERLSTTTKVRLLSPRRSNGRQIRRPSKYRHENLNDKQGQGRWKKALAEALERLDGPGREANPTTYSSMLRLCRNSKALLEGKRVHGHIIKRDYQDEVCLGNLLVQLYGNCACFQDARAVFDRMAERNVVSWTSMIAAYVQQGKGNDALVLFQQMLLEEVKPNRVTFLSILPACASQPTLAAANQVHTLIVHRGAESDIVVGTALLNMYGKFGSLTDAWCMFDRMHERNVVSWNAMIAAYTQHGKDKESLEVFQHMLRVGVQPSKVTFVSSLHACAGQVALAQGKWMHSYISSCGFQSDIDVGTALVNMYGKCGSLQEAQEVFHNMDVKDVVTWTTLIAAYAQHGQGKEALRLFKKMEQNGVAPNKITFVTVLDACASQVALVKGKRMHVSIIKAGLDLDVTVGNALANMYGKCGSLDNAQKVFDGMLEKNKVSWSALIAAYAQQGKGKIALEFFQQMQLEGVVPDQLTFSSILSACSHAGLVDEGRHYFASMCQHYAIPPTVQHYNCMIDLLGRTGRLDECGNLIKEMSFPPTAASWMAVLAACRIHFDTELGEYAAKRAFELNPENAVPYVVLSNIYAFKGRWTEAAAVRNPMNDRVLRSNYAAL